MCRSCLYVQSARNLGRCAKDGCHAQELQQQSFCQTWMGGTHSAADAVGPTQYGNVSPSEPGLRCDFRFFLWLHVSGATQTNERQQCMHKADHVGSCGADRLGAGLARHPHNLHKWAARRTRWQPRPTAIETRPFVLLSHIAHKTFRATSLLCRRVAISKRQPIHSSPYITNTDSIRRE